MEPDMELAWQAAIGRMHVRAGQGLAMLGRGLADLAVPPVCSACRTPLERHDTLCADCWRAIDFVRPPICERLGIPLPYDTGGPALSARAIAEPPAFDRARAVARYHGAMREIVHRLKYGDQQHGLRLLGRWLALAGAELTAGADLVVPVPLARWRLWQRRFNQAALLAQAFATRAGLRHEPLLLERQRATASQVGLTLDERRRNVQGAFRIAPGREREVAGRALIVVDDVVTTGSTASAIARTLRRAGARRVDVLALALVTGDSPANE